MNISKHFQRSEFECKCGCGFDTVDVNLIELLETIREHFVAPVRINSGSRCFKYNRSIGSSDSSQHTKGKAADIVVEGVSSSDVAQFIQDTSPNKGGLGHYDTFTHVDVRDSLARWYG